MKIRTKIVVQRTITTGTTAESHKLKATINSIALLFIAFVFVSCDANRVFEDYKNLPSSGWHKDSIATFQVDIEEVNKNFNVLVDTRNLESYPYSNIWLFVSITSPDTTVLTDTVEYILAEPNGKWIGQGTGGVYSNQFEYRNNVFFPQEGTYTFSIQQGMRDEKLKGLKDIGLRVETNN